jgi:flagellar biosynthesis GTPase FlhF
MSAANNSPKIEALAQNLGLREVDTNQVIRQIARDILLSMHGKGNKKLDAKIEKVYSEWNKGAKWEDDNEQITSILLVGPPGHGKTTSFKEASKLVASALGMEFLENANRRCGLRS